MKEKILKEGQSCRKCGFPVVRVYRNDRTVKKKTYYFKSWLKCNNCKTIYMLESEKVICKNDEQIMDLFS